ncbi:hypothetical protein PINS_up011255 [Pythium insidiosum]|nr:hypothetical protein PINS_up011255 [Pythium insidiosum]
MGDVADAVAALGKAVASTDKEKARRRVVDILASTSSGRAAQQLCEALVQSSPSRDATVTDLKSVAAICVDRPRKAELLAFTLLQQLVVDAASTEDVVETHADALLQVSLANPFTLSGFLAALEHRDFQAHLDAVLQVIRRALVGALVSPSGISCALKLSIVHALVRVAFGSDDPDHRTLSTVGSVLVQATSLFLESDDPEASSTFSTLASSTVDVLCEIPSLSSSSASWPRVVAAAILRRVAFAIDHDLAGLLSLLQSLVDLVETHPDALLSSSVLLGVCARLLVHPECGSLEQSLVLRVLHALFLGDRPQATRAVRPRGVYVEILLVPLVSTVSTLPTLAAPLLQWVMDVTTATDFVPVDLVDLSRPPSAPDADTVHVWTFLELLARTGDAEDWLNSMFAVDATPVSIPDPTWLAVQLGALLVDRRGSLRVAALGALDRQVQHHRHAWGAQASATVRLLVSTLVHLTSYRRTTSVSDDDACWLSHGLQTLVRVAATTSETLKVALRLVQRLRSQSALRAQALHLLFLMWTHDTRVYPQLESTLLETEEASEGEDEDDDTELAVVRMATLLGLCERDPERGVEWVTAVQRGLEDPQAPVAAMAVRAVTALCAAEWLDLDTTVKILATKKKKGRLAAVDDLRVQRELCRLYALAGPETSAKCTARAVDELWTLVEAEDAGVRCEAVKALVGIPLASVGLQVAERDDDDEDDDEEDEEDEEASVREKVEHLWNLLETERDVAVRTQLEALLARVAEAEGQQLHGSVSGRSVDVDWALESRVSSAATKELRRAVPTRDRVLAALDGTTMESWRRLLFVYVPSEAADASSLKRKDKRLRIVQLHVDDMASTLDRVLTSIASAGSAASGWWTAADDSAHNLLDALLWKDAWQSFMTKFVDRLMELAELKTPSTAAASANSVHTIVDSLQQRTASEPMAFVALAALSHQLTRQRVDDHGASTAIRRALRQSVDERRVFKASTQPRDDGVRRCLLVATLLLSPSASATIEADVALARAVVDDETETSLHRAVAVLCLGQYGAVMARDVSSELSSLKTIAEGVWNGLLTSASLRSQPTTELFPLPMVDVDVHSPAIGFVSTSMRSSNPEARTTLLWAACMALATFSTQFPRRQRLDWLNNLHVALANVQSSTEGRDAAFVLAVARAPVLLSSAQFNVVSSDEVSEFVAELTQRLNASASSPSSARDVASLVLPAMLSRMTRLRGGYAVDIAAVVEPVVQQLSNVDAAFAQAAAANWFHCDIGVFAGCAGDRDDDAESDAAAAPIDVAWDVATAQRMLQSLRETSTAAAVLADRSESLVVVQKNKTFDVELPAVLSNTSLLFKILAFLRDAAQNRSTDRRAVATMTLSMLRCLCRVPHVIPSIDLATLLARLARRFGADAGRDSNSDSVLGATLSLASMHGSGVEYLRRHAFTRSQLLNMAPHVLVQAIKALIKSADPSNTSTRRGRGKVVSPALLTEFLRRHFVALANRWTTSSRGDLVDAWGGWIDGLTKLLQASAADDKTQTDEGAIGPLASLVLDHVLPGLPFSPLDVETGHVRVLLERMGADVLAPVALWSPEHGERIVTWLLSKPEEERSAWWYRGIILASFVDRVGVDGDRLRASPRLIFQWLLQQDFDAWSNASSSTSDSLVLDLATVIALSPTTKDPIGGHETWMLETLDCIHRDMTSQAAVLDGSRLLKWRVFFALVATVVVLHHAQSHERELLKHECLLESAAWRTMTATMLRLHRGNTPVAMWDRLVALREHVVALSRAHALSTLNPFLSVIDALISQIHVARDDRLSSQQKKSMLTAVSSYT